jgi:hypothetical protein
MGSKVIRDYLKQIAQRGGEAGKGKAKVRGGAEYYKRISRKGVKAREAKRKQESKT